MKGPVSFNLSPPTSPEQAQAQAQALSWLNAPVMRLYANGFAVAQSNADFTVVMLVNGVPSGILNMSFVAAKTLVQELDKAVNNLEKGLEQVIPSMEEVAAKMGMAQENKPAETK
jgi:hypothetical protein